MHGTDELPWADRVALDYERKLSRERALKERESSQAKMMEDPVIKAAFGSKDPEKEKANREESTGREVWDREEELARRNDASVDQFYPSNRDRERDADLAAEECKPGTLTLAGAELVAYVRVKAASVAAMAAQQQYEAASKELRAAIESMCQTMAPPVK